jgi:hypothetical protein
MIARVREHTQECRTDEEADLSRVINAVVLEDVGMP